MGYFNRILNNCNDTSLLLLKSKEGKVTPRQRLEMRFHTYFCKCCQNFEKQSGLIDKSLRAYFRDIAISPPVKPSEEFKKKIREELNKCS
jgi:hypothetical protein